MNQVLRIGPSILTADLLRLGDEIAAAERAGVDFIHLDIMDGRFVPNLTFGPLVVDAVRRATDLPLDVHLMIVEPDRYVEAFVAAGADRVTVHVEATLHLHAVLSRIRALGAAPGVTLNPVTPISAIAEAVPFVDQVLVMSVNPGFGGQTFIPTALRRISETRDLIERVNPHCWLAVDGGIKPSNVARVVEAGANTIIAGSAIFSAHESAESGVKALRSAADGRE